MIQQEKLQHKYLSLPAAFPWRKISANRFIASHMADIDGDGCEEVIVAGWQHLYNSSPKLGVLSYFTYGALAQEWASVPMPEQLVVSEQRDTTTTEKIMFAKLRLKGISDIVVFDTGSGMLSVVGYTGVVDTDNQTGVTTLKLTTLGSETDTVKGQKTNPAQPDWDTNQEHTFAIGDVDGDGLDEILVLNHYNPAKMAQTKLGLFKWNEAANALNVTWTSSNGTVPALGDKPLWNVFSGNKFYIGDMDGDGKSEVVAFDGSAYLGVYKWNSDSPGLQSVWQASSKVHSATPGVPDWSISKNDWFTLADVNGDKKKELLAFNGAQLGVLSFDGSQLQVLSINTGVIPGRGVANWTIATNQIHLSGSFQSADRDAIIVTNVGAQFAVPYRNVGMLRWIDPRSGFQVDGALINTVTNPLQQLSNFIATRDAVYTVADVNGDGIDEVMVQSDSAGKVGYVKWVNGQFMTQWLAGADDLKSWGFGMIANAPATSFRAYWNGKPAIYSEIYQHASLTLTKTQNISNSGNADMQNTEYPNKSNADLRVYASDLKAGKNADANNDDWGWTKKYNHEDIVNVFNQLIDEIVGAACSNTLRNNVIDLYNAYTDQRRQDFATVKQNLTVVPPDKTAIEWSEKIGKVLLSGLEGVLGIVQPEMAVGLSLCISVFELFDTGKKEVVTVDFGSVESWFEREKQSAIDSMNALQNQIIADPLKLRYCGALSQGSFGWNVTFDDDIDDKRSDENRLSFYRMLLGKVFSIYKSTSVARLTESVDGGDVKIPSSAVWVDARETDCDVYKMATGDDNYNASFPSQNLIDDLTNKLKIPLNVLFKGGGDLNMSVQNGSAPQSDFAQFYTTNKTDKKVWITVYGIDQGHPLQSGWLDAGASQIWASRNYLYGSIYHIKAEVKQNDTGGATIYTTSIQINPQVTSLSCKNYAVKIAEGNSNYYWEKVK